MFASYYYIFMMMTNIASLAFVSYFAPRGAKGRDCWVYVSAFLIGGFVDTLIYLIYPVAPPIRVSRHLERGVVQIRNEILPWSDALITLKYSAFPSGHVFYTLFGYLVCREEKFRKAGWYYLTNACVFSFIILYLGEHYWFDIVGSIILAVTVFYITTRIIDLKYPPKNLNKKNNSYCKAGGTGYSTDYSNHKWKSL